MSEIDCIFCSADRDTGHVECRSCGRIFEEPSAEVIDLGSYFASISFAVPATATAVMPAKRPRLLLFAHRKP